MSVLGALGLGITITGNDKASPVFRGIRGSLSDLRAEADRTNRAMNQVGAVQGNRMADAGKAGGNKNSMMGAGAAGVAGGLGSLASVAVPAGLGVGLMSAAQAGGDFNRALDVMGLKAGASAQQLELLRAKSIELGLSTKFGPTQVVEAMDALVSAGMNANQVLATVSSTLKFAQAAKGLSVQDSAQLIAQSLAVFKTQAKDAGPLLDRMAKSADMFALDLKDLPLGLANSNRGISAMNATADEALIAFGLMKGMIPRVASAGTAAGLSMEAMGSERVQKALKGLGIAVGDSSGKFRPFLDIVGELMPQLRGMTEMKRATFLRETFGADAVQGLTAVMTQLENGIEGGNGKLLKGADAVAYLREQMANSNGQLDKFSDKMGGGFSGAMDKATAKMKTLQTVIGDPIGNMASPYIEKFGSQIVDLSKGFGELDSNGQKAVAMLIILGVVGAVAFGTMGIAALPVLAVLGLIVGAASLVKRAIDENIGGMGDKFNGLVAGVSLVGRALFDVFANGGLSEGVAKDLNKNAGAKSFVEGLIDGFNRAKHFAESLGESLMRVFDSPIVAAMGESLAKLGDSLGLTSSSAGDSSSKWEKWGKVGRIAGEFIVAAIEVVSQKITQASEFVNGFMKHWDEIKTVVDPIVNLIKTVGTEVALVAGKMGMLSPDGKSKTWELFGSVVGSVIAMISKGISQAATVLEGLSLVFSGVMKMVKGVFTGDWNAVWTGAQKVVLGLAIAIVEIMANAMLKVGGLLDGMAKLAGIDIGAGKFIEGIKAEMLGGLRDQVVEVQAKEARAATGNGAPAPITSQAAVAVGGEATGGDQGFQGMFGSLNNLAASIKSQPVPVVNVVVKVDGEDIPSTADRIGGREPTR